MRKLSIFIVLFSMIFLQATCEKENTTNMNPNPPEIEESPIFYLALGDSYTIGESVEVAERWPVQLVQGLRGAEIDVEAPRIIAQTGWTTGNLKDAIATANLDNQFDLVSLLIGVNNQYQGRSIEEYRVEFEQLLLKSVELAGGDKDKVFVVSIPDYGVTPFGASNEEAIREAIDRFNSANKELTEKHEIRYFDITPISREAKSDAALTATDNLHPSGKMYERWVNEVILEEVKEMVKQK